MQLNGPACVNGIMNHLSIPKKAVGLLGIGLIFVGSSVVRLYDAFKAGLAQGFRPNATLVVMGKLGYHSISLQGELRASSLHLLIGVVLVGFGIWSCRSASAKSARTL